MPRSSACAAIVLISLLLPFAGDSPGAAQEVVCARAAFAPTLDGRLDDWPRLPLAVMADADGWHPAAVEHADYGGPDDLSAEIRLAWDGDGLYVMLETRDDLLVRVRSAGEIDRGDSLVLAFAAEGAEEVNQFVVALLRRGPTVSLIWRAEPAAEMGEVRTIDRALVARPEEAGGSRVSYELAIPWADLKFIRPVEGERFTFTLSVCDDDGAGLEGCLERSFPVVLSSGLITDIPRPPEPDSPPVLMPAFAAPELARYDERSFAFNNEDALVLAGAVDYARLPRETWAERLDALEAAGLNAASIAVPWSHHQPAPDMLDLGDLRAFLDLCKAAGLWVQVDVGPYMGEGRPAGDVPEWVIAADGPGERTSAVEQWYQTVLPIIAAYQLTADGTVISVTMRPLPDRGGRVTAAALVELESMASGAGLSVPILTANAPAARANTTQVLANMLDTLSFYEPVGADEMVERLHSLAGEQRGPSVIAALPGSYRSAAAARRSFDMARIALANGVSALALADFAPGPDPTAPQEPGDYTGAGVIEVSGARSPGYGECRLFAGLAGKFGPELARSACAEGVVEADHDDVHAAARLSGQRGFIFLWSENNTSARQVRLKYLPPGCEEWISIPEAGAINVPAGAAKMLPLEVPLGRGSLRYTTSEIGGLHSVGERTLLIVYGEVDTAGELAIRLPGTPLVMGGVTRQHWDAEEKTLVLDYFHGRDDRYILVDEIEICILSRSRAAMVAAVGEGAESVSISGGIHVSGGRLGADGLRAVLECPAGAVELTAALPARPSSVTIDGGPVEFDYSTPDRVLRLRIETESFESEQRPGTLWKTLERAISGGPPGLSAEFDRGRFMPDARALGAMAAQEAVHIVSELGVPLQAVGVAPGDFVRARARFRTAGRVEASIMGSADPALVFVNGEIVMGLSGSALSRQADLTPLVGPDENEIELVVQTVPRQLGLPGLYGAPAMLPKVVLMGDDGEIVADAWEVRAGLAGERAGWADPAYDDGGWHYIRFGPWREQGRDLAGVRGVGWYRVAFDLPDAAKWNLRYRLALTLHSAGSVYINGAKLATCGGEGTYILPLPDSPLSGGGRNVAALALYGLGPQAGLHWLAVGVDKERLTRNRVLDIRFGARRAKLDNSMPGDRLCG